MISEMLSGNLRCGFTITSADTVVDIGCFEGDACVLAGGLGAAVIGIDIDGGAVQRAIERMKKAQARSFQGIVSACDPIPLPDATATAVICTETLEHVDHPGRFARELVRIGKPGCHYLITVPDPVSEGLMKIVAPHWYFERPFHQRVYQHRDLRKLVEDAGLGVVAHKTHGFHASLWWVFRMALGLQGPGELATQAALLADWDRTYQSLLATPKGADLIEAFNSIIPKSQVLIARKPGGRNRLAFIPFPHSWKARLRRWVRDGKFRIGNFDVTWNVRRASA